MSPGDLIPPSDTSAPWETIPQAGTGWSIEMSLQEVTAYPTLYSGRDGENDRRHEPAGAPIKYSMKLVGDNLARRAA